MTPFQAGIALTALVLAGVTFEKSLFELRRSRERGPGFSWTRWYHLVVMWGLILFVTPFVLGVLYPSRLAELSGKLDRAAGTRFIVEEPAAPRSGEPVDSHKLAVRETRRAQAVALASAVAVIGLGAGASFGRKSRKPKLMAAMSACALLSVVAGFALAGEVASGMSGAPMARRTLAQYAAAPVIGVEGEEEAAAVDGPVAVMGAVESSTPTKGGNFFDGSLAGESAGPYGGFTVGAYLVPAHGPGGVHVAKPHVRLGPEGREAYIRSDEEIIVYGYAEGGEIRPRPGYPVVVAPAGAEKALVETGATLFGAESRRRRYLLMFQIALWALAAWHAAGLAAALTESVLASRSAKGGATGGEPADA